MQILTHNSSLSSVRDAPLLPSPHAPNFAIVNLTCHVHLPQELSPASAACSIVIHSHIRYRTYLVLLINTTGEKNIYKTTTLFSVLFGQSHYTWLLSLLVTFCFKGVFLKPSEPNLTLVLRAFFRSSCFQNVSRGGDGGTLNSLKAIVNPVGGFWPIGVFFAGYHSFFLFLVDKLRRKHAFKHVNEKKLARIAALYK